MATRKALGRGLSALIPQEPVKPAAAESGEPSAGDGPLFVPLRKIQPNPRQPRKVFREEQIASLAASIREQGILQPLVVRERSGDGGSRYELIIGERRWRAAQEAGLEEAPVVILDATDRTVLEMALVENVQRADLNPIELAEAFRVLIEDESMTQEEVGRRVALDRSSVANHLRLLELPVSMQGDVIEGRITMGHAKAILQAPEDLRAMLRDQIQKRSLSVRAAEDLARRMASSAGRDGPRRGPSRDVHVVDAENQLRRELKTKVRIVGRRDRGRIELHFFGETELNRLIQLLTGES